MWLTQRTNAYLETQILLENEGWSLYPFYKKPIFSYNNLSLGRGKGEGEMNEPEGKKWNELLESKKVTGISISFLKNKIKTLAIHTSFESMLG